MDNNTYPTMNKELYQINPTSMMQNFMLRTQAHQTAVGPKLVAMLLNIFPPNYTWTQFLPIPSASALSTNDRQTILGRIG
jgi:hypothetical protein